MFFLPSARYFVLLFIVGCGVTHPLDKTIKSTAPYGDNLAAGRYVKVNDVSLYVEVYGRGDPLLLLHGNGGSIGSMGKQIAYFSKYYQVIALDTRGHGRSSTGDSTLSYRQFARDTLALLSTLKLSRINVLGVSDGGNIGLLLAIKAPEKVAKLVTFGANLYPGDSAVYPWANSWVQEKLTMANMQIKNNHAPKKWLLEAQQLSLLLDKPNISINALDRIQAKVLVSAADRDLIRLEHTQLIFENIKDAQLAIIPGSNHWLVSEKPLIFNYLVHDFLRQQKPMPTSKQALQQLEIGEH